MIGDFSNLFPVARFTWIDIVVLLIILRAAFVGFRRGAVIELSFIIGVILLSVISIHYHRQVGYFLTIYTKIPFRYSNFLSFFILIGGGFIIIWVISRIITIAINLGPPEIFNKILGIGVGIARGAIVGSILLYLLILLNIDYLTKLIKQSSWSGPFILNLAPQVYEFVKSLF